jgi:hypothetical protein
MNFTLSRLTDEEVIDLAELVILELPVSTIAELLVDALPRSEVAQVATLLAAAASAP